MPSPKDTGGPIVKSGPTAGKVRSKNRDGSWRRKRKDAGKSRKSGGLCFLTTAACEHKGLPDDCFELNYLRDFRDTYLLKTYEGSLLVDEYYRIAPKLTPKLTDESDLDFVWTVIHDCIKAIESGESDKAVMQYRDMVYLLIVKHFNQSKSATL